MISSLGGIRIMTSREATSRTLRAPPLEPTRLPPRYPPAFIARIPMGLGLSVEIGCAGGELGAWMARRDPGARRIGIAADPAEAARAAPRYDAVHVAPPEADAPVPAGTADLVILHGPVTGPAAAIAAAAKLLAPTGILLADIPNAGHWRLAEAALA